MYWLPHLIPPIVAVHSQETEAGLMSKQAAIVSGQMDLSEQQTPHPCK